MKLLTWQKGYKNRVHIAVWKSVHWL